MTRTFRIPTGRRRWAAAGAGFVVVVLAAVLAFELGGSDSSGSPSARRGDSSLAGKPLPPVAMKRFDTTGTRVQLADLAQGKPMVVNVWSSTCEPCKQEMPALDAVAGETKGRVVFVGVNVRDSAATGERFFRKYGATYPQVRDPRAELATKVGSPVIPTTLIVDANGNIVDGHLGALTQREVRALLAADLGVHAGS